MNNRSEIMGSEKMSDDVKKMIKELLLRKKSGAQLLMEDIVTEVSRSMVNGKNRFKEFHDCFEKEFPNNSTIRAVADGLTYTLFHNIFELFFIGNNSALFVEIHGLIERISIDKMCDLLAINKKAQMILGDAFSKKTLNEIAPYFENIKLWNSDDVKFAKKISTIRNGIAHKNTSLVSKHLSDGKHKSISSIDDITSKINMIPYIIHAIKLIIKISEVLKPNIIKNPRFNARLEAYNRIIGPILNFHGEMLIGNYPIEIEHVILNRLYSRAILLSDDKLGDLLFEFKDKVLKFHEQLKEKSNANLINTHKELTILVDKILSKMKEQLNIDAKTSFFTNTPKPATIEEVKKYLTQELNKREMNT